MINGLPRLPHNSPRPIAQIIHQHINRRQHQQRDGGRKNQTTDNGAGHREVRRAVAADLRRADAQRNEAEPRLSFFILLRKIGAGGH